MEVSVIWCMLYTTAADSPGTSRAGGARSKVLQVRLNPDEFEAIATVLIDVADQLRAVATRMNPNAVGA